MALLHAPASHKLHACSCSLVCSKCAGACMSLPRHVQSSCRIECQPWPHPPAHAALRQTSDRAVSLWNKLMVRRHRESPFPSCVSDLCKLFIVGQTMSAITPLSRCAGNPSLVSALVVRHLSTTDSLSFKGGARTAAFSRGPDRSPVLCSFVFSLHVYLFA